MKCIKCGRELNDNERSCMFCGEINPYNPENFEFIKEYGTKEQKKAMNLNKIKIKDNKKILLIILLIIVIILIIFLFLGENK